eukprot:TRINITY_DN1041_c0_g3_i2.p1 TRINITY_DN1041_c0_g3~~TRINITY_DN1041_c0_g3_i2.p1  ORF type:complete len:258 (-),score=28.94 TRINITY_DN1041_c0_g3_i2:47-820(-)
MTKLSNTSSGNEKRNSFCFFFFVLAFLTTLVAVSVVDRDADDRGGSTHIPALDATVMDFCDSDGVPETGGRALCIPCPANGHCVDGTVACDAGFVAQSQGNDRVVCVLDLEEVQETGRLKQQMLHLLSERAHKYHCSYWGVDSAGLTDAELKEQLELAFHDQSSRHGVNFARLYENAKGEIKSQGSNESSIELHKTQDNVDVLVASVGDLPFMCALRHHLAEFASPRNICVLVLLGIVALFLLYIVARRRRQRMRHY